MTDRMLKIANQANEKVAQTLGYRNVEFKSGLLEELPLNEAQADVVISNCVVNLSESKRRVFQGIFRVLKPGGRLPPWFQAPAVFLRSVFRFMFLQRSLHPHPKGTSVGRMQTPLSSYNLFELIRE